MSQHPAPPGPSAPLARAAATARRLLACDELWFLLPTGDPSQTSLTFPAEGTEGAVTHLPAGAIPRALCPEDGAFVVGDAASELDPEAPGVRELVARGLRSLLVAPLRGPDGRPGGHVGFGSHRIGAFHASQQSQASAAGELLGAAVESERALAAEREQRASLESLAKLLPTVATTLDIREVFQQFSAIVKEVLPHEALGIQLVQPDQKTIVAYVVADRIAGDEWNYALSRELQEHDLQDAVVHDLTFEGEGEARRAKLRAHFFTPESGPEGIPIEATVDEHRTRLVFQHGFQSFLRTILWRGNEKIGGLVFSSTRPGQFHAGQLETARRIAQYVALAVSHRHLAEEAERAAEARARAAMLEDRVQELVQQAEEREGFHRVVGESPNWKDVLLKATRVATTDTTVLLTGESGTGKEVVARFIHRGSPRANGPLVAVNCAALPEQLLESELFGYERGAFSGALAPKPGRIEQAARGVLFLDEIGEMSMSLQAKLLRVLQEREFQRLGGTRTLKADVRVIAATNRDLIAAMKRGEFREDLFYRLRVFEIRLPALRERRDDILPLTETFLGDLERTLGQRTAGLSREAREILLAYDWPGNIRELRNALERAVILCDGGLITGEQLPLGISDGAPGLSQPAGPDMNVETVERDLIQKALAKAGNNKSKAARLLGLSRAQLYFRLEKYGLAEPPR